MQKLKSKVKNYIASLEAVHLKRYPTIMPKDCLNFSSNDYLGLSSHPLLQRAYQEGFGRYAIGSTGSILVSGYHEPHQTLESAFATALQVDQALLFPSGYAANLSVMQLLAQLKIHVLIDKAIHASFYDGLRLSGASYTRYPHNQSPLHKQYPEETLLLTESIFSMSGAKPDLQQLAAQYPLVVDEAHAFGVCGPKGLGEVMAQGLTQQEVPLRIIPLGKAMGLSGAIVAGDKDWITALIQSARPLIYSTAMSPALLYGLRQAFDLLLNADESRLSLQQLISTFREHVKDSPLTWQHSVTPIQQLRLGCPQKAVFWARQLLEKNIYCVPMREPTVARASTGLRIVLNSKHTEADVAFLFECLHQCAKSI